jgi:hypothetical protein
MLFGWANIPFRFNNAWTFDKVNDSAILNNASVGNFGTGDFTYSFSFLTPNNLTDEIIIYKRDSGSPFSGIYFVRGSANQLVFSVGHTTAAGSIHNTAAGLLLANNWYHIVLCKQTTTRANWRLYINNVLTGFGANTGTETNGVNSTNAINFARDPANNVYGRVFIDETTVYNRALTPAEVAFLYNAGNGNAPHPSMLANLVARYSFDTAAGVLPNPILADLSGNGNNGTGQNFSVSPLIPH